MDSAIFVRVICNDQKRNDFFDRLQIFCKENNFEPKFLKNESYWKIEGLFEIEIEMSPAPIWNYGAWSTAYRFLFEQEFTIKWEENEDISLCCYPAVDDFDSYFVIVYIPSRCFVPKPSKTIQH